MTETEYRDAFRVISGLLEGAFDNDDITETEYDEALAYLERCNEDT